MNEYNDKTVQELKALAYDLIAIKENAKLTYENALAYCDHELLLVNSKIIEKDKENVELSSTNNA